MNQNLKTLELPTSEKRVALTALLKLLSAIGIKSAHPHHQYGGPAARMEMVTQLMQSGMISPTEARRMLVL